VASPARWHVSPFCDVALYAFGWLWLLVPSLMMGPRPLDYVLVYIAASVVSAVHIHFTFPYVYLDGDVRRSHFWRFVPLPLVVVAAFFARVLLASAALDAFMIFVGIAVSVWNLWHVLMQKYGFLRLYAAKRGDPRPGERPLPAWIDRFFVCAWLGFLPSILVWQSRVVVRLLGDAPLVLQLLTALRPFTTPMALAGGAIVVAAHALFVRAEWRAYRLRDAPRLWMAAGTSLLSLLVVVDPMRGGICYLFSHALEYMVFVWAYQRRKHSAPRAAGPRLARILRRPLLAYGAFTLALGAGFAYFGPWAHLHFQYPQSHWLGVETGDGWVTIWLLFASALHFYFDGFLWKMRRPEVRANL
jgi:hypothetical protein